MKRHISKGSNRRGPRMCPTPKQEGGDQRQKESEPMTRTITDDANQQSGSSPPLYTSLIYTDANELLGVEVELHYATHCRAGYRFPPTIGEPACPCLSGFMVLVWTNIKGAISLVELKKHDALVE